VFLQIGAWITSYLLLKEESNWAALFILFKVDQLGHVYSRITGEFLL
jgi:hypothetical protein